LIFRALDFADSSIVAVVHPDAAAKEFMEQKAEK